MGNSYRVLLVDDNPGDANLAVELLLDGTDDIEATIKPDAEQALEYLHSYAVPDC